MANYAIKVKVVDGDEKYTTTVYHKDIKNYTIDQDKYLHLFNDKDEEVAVYIAGSWLYIINQEKHILNSNDFVASPK